MGVDINMGENNIIDVEYSTKEIVINEEPYYTSKQVADLLGISEEIIIDWSIYFESILNVPIKHMVKSYTKTNLQQLAFLRILIEDKECDFQQAMDHCLKYGFQTNNKIILNNNVPQIKENERENIKSLTREEQKQFFLEIMGEYKNDIIEKIIDVKKDIQSTNDKISKLESTTKICNTKIEKSIDINSKETKNYISKVDVSIKKYEKNTQDGMSNINRKVEKIDKDIKIVTDLREKTYNNTIRAKDKKIEELQKELEEEKSKSMFSKIFHKKK